MLQYSGSFGSAILVTLGVSAGAVLLGVVLGIIISLLRLYAPKPFKFIATAYVEFIRGTPLLVQIMAIYYGIPNANAIVSGVIAMGINSSAYVAEIFRSGIQSVEKGQNEAARSLGMSGTLSMFKIILPQALKNILPALGNEFIVVIKESSILSMAGVIELMKVVDNIRGQTYRSFEPLLVVSIIYFILTFGLSKLLGFAEAKMNRSERI